jgi:hypothetical protein
MNSQPKNLVGNLNPNRRRLSCRGRYAPTALTGVAFASGIVAAVTSAPRTRGVALALLVVAVIGAAFSWLIARSSGLSRSGDNMSDFTDIGGPYDPPRG